MTGPISPSLKNPFVLKTVAFLRQFYNIASERAINITYTHPALCLFFISKILYGRVTHGIYKKLRRKYFFVWRTQKKIMRNVNILILDFFPVGG